MCQCAHHALVLSVELPLKVIGYDPDRSNRLAMIMKRHQHRFDEAWLGQKCGKTAIRQMHQLGGVLIDADTARTGVTRHRGIAIGGEYSSHSLPANDVTLQYADPGSVG